uniref:Uncharacterized protein n=1 Tax=Eutreptiella gymnastica TaxID=73025 RepID=A0A7S1N4K3_9EUGL|mmetsp:Transcript_118499/g.206287  ORF Transcript_118499/g.206287 Transcript_118499/m.206287 type:complete len:113 (+) Transcript_118499:462-800(+)
MRPLSRAFQEDHPSLSLAHGRIRANLPGDDLLNEGKGQGVRQWPPPSGVALVHLFGPGVCQTVSPSLPKWVALCLTINKNQVEKWIWHPRKPPMPRFGSHEQHGHFSVLRDP